MAAGFTNVRRAMDQLNQAQAELYAAIKEDFPVGTTCVIGWRKNAYSTGKVLDHAMDRVLMQWMDGRTRWVSYLQLVRPHLMK